MKRLFRKLFIKEKKYYRYDYEEGLQTYHPEPTFTETEDAYIFTPEEWSYMLNYTTPIKSIPLNSPTLFGQIFLGHKHRYSTKGGEKHDLLYASYRDLDGTLRAACGKKILTKRKVKKK